MATSAAHTAAGTILSISAGIPTAETGVAYAAVTGFEEVAELVDIGNLGKKYTVVNHNPIGNRATFKVKGSYDSGDLQLKMAKAVADAGQLLCLTALDDDANYTFKIAIPDVATLYFQGKVTSFVNAIGSVNSIVGGEVAVAITGDIFEVAAP